MLKSRNFPYDNAFFTKKEGSIIHERAFRGWRRVGSRRNDGNGYPISN